MNRSNIIKGDELMLFYNSEAFAYATSHSLSMSADTVSVASKDHGFWGANEVGKLNWEITTENLYTDDDYDTLFDLYTNAEPITVAFAKVSNYDKDGLTYVGGSVAAWAPDTSYYRSGLAVISSLQVNANTGENATLSATLTGAGPLTKMS